MRVEYFWEAFIFQNLNLILQETKYVQTKSWKREVSILNLIEKVLFEKKSTDIFPSFISFIDFLVSVAMVTYSMDQIV